MGFPYEEATWDTVSGAMYMGAGGSMPAMITWLSVALCVIVLWVGNSKEHSLYSEYH